MILSCVHKREAKQNTEGEKYGLLSDRNMLNTAFTRTKLAIIAVGHAVTLWSLGKCEIMWRKYIQVRKKLIFRIYDLCYTISMVINIR